MLRSAPYPYHAAIYTFTGCVENGVGMQQIGQKRPGLTAFDLRAIGNSPRFKNNKTKIVDLAMLSGLSHAPAAHLLFIYGDAVHGLGGDADALFEEAKNATWDKTAFMRGRVVNKHARYNCCVADCAQVADIPNKQGTVHSFSQMFEANRVRIGLGQLGQECLSTRDDKPLADLFAEGNQYYSRNTGIGAHGDSERNIVVGINMGSSRHLQFRLYHKNVPISKWISILMNHGNIYAMDLAATGHNWRKSSLYTWRHRAGDQIFLARDDKQLRSRYIKRGAEEQYGILQIDPSSDDETDSETDLCDTEDEELVLDRLRFRKKQKIADRKLE